MARLVSRNSLGAAVCHKFLADHPEKVQAAIAVGAPTFPLDELLAEDAQGTKRPFTEIYLGALRTGGYTHFWRTVWKPTLSYEYHKDFVNTPLGSYLVNYFFEDRYARLNADASGPINVLDGLREQGSLMKELRNCKVPAALVVGDGDDTLPCCEDLHRHLPQVEYLVIKNSGHFCFQDQAQVFNDFMLRFLRKNQA